MFGRKRTRCVLRQLSKIYLEEIIKTKQRQKKLCNTVSIRPNIFYWGYPEKISCSNSFIFNYNFFSFYLLPPIPMFFTYSIFVPFSLLHFFSFLLLFRDFLEGRSTVLTSSVKGSVTTGGNAFQVTRFYACVVVSRSERKRNVMARIAFVLIHCHGEGRRSVAVFLP